MTPPPANNTASYPGDCGAHFGRHPTMTHLVGVCTRPEGHDGEHLNVLHKPGQDPDRRR